MLRLGKRHMELAKLWVTSAATYGGISFILMCYVTDWQVTNRWIPFYRNKFPPVEEPTKKK